jgi:transcription antitermination factor NusG
MRSLHYWHDRRKFVELPLFPCYIFVYLKSNQDYYAGLNIEGVWRYLREGVNIAKVSEKIIENMRRAIHQGSDVEVSDGYFRPRQVLTIQKGVFAGLSCEVVQVNGNKKLLVRIDLLKRVILLSIPAGQMAEV